MTSVKCTPPPVISINVEPRTKDSELALLDALKDLANNDPRLTFTVDDESGETTISGASELHLDSVVGELLSLGIGINVGAPQVNYRETLARNTVIDYTHKKQTGGIRQFARVKLRMEPKEIGKGNEFTNEIISGAVPAEYIPGVEKGIKSVLNDGVLIGFPLVDMKVTLLDGGFHEFDSSPIAFEIAARAAMKEGCEKGGVTILEPIMVVEVVTHPDFIGAIMGDINSRRGQILDRQLRDNALVIRAYVPLDRLFGFDSQLRNISNWHANYDMRFSHYQAVPSNVSPDPDAFPPAIGMRA